MDYKVCRSSPWRLFCPVVLSTKELEKTVSKLFGDVPIFILLNKCDRSKQEVADILQNMKDQCPWARAVVPIVAEAKHGPILKVCGACNSDEILIMCTERKRFYVCQNSVCTEFEKQQEVKRSYGIEKLQEETLKCLPELVARSFRQVEMECLQDLHTRALNYIMACGTLAAAAGAIPLPFSDVFLLFSIQTAMFASLAKLYDVQVCSRTTHRLVISISGLGGIGVGGKLLGTLLKFIPGIGSVLGGVCCASIASIFTIAMGLLFQKMLEGIRSRALFGEISFEHFCDMMDLQQQREFLQQKVQELRSRPTQDTPLRRNLFEQKHDRYFEIIDVFYCFVFWCLFLKVDCCFRYAGTWQIAEHESYNWQQFYLGTSCAQDLIWDARKTHGKSCRSRSLGWYSHVN